jgi:hypothetical protein
VPPLQPQLNLGAVAIGLAVDVICTTLAGVVLLAHLGADLADQEKIERLSQSRPALLVGLPMGLFFTAFGGFVAAAFARGSELDHALAVGVAGAVIGLLASIVMRPALWYLAVSVALTIPAAVAGGYAATLTLP